jgi:hypothetical protein
VHESAVADGRKKKGKGQAVPQNADAKVHVLKGNSGRWPKIDFVEGQAIFIQRTLAVGAQPEPI